MPRRCRLGMHQLRQHATRLKYDIVEIVTESRLGCRAISVLVSDEQEEPV